MLEQLIVENYIENTLGRSELNIGWSILEELTFAKDSLECAKLALSLVEKIVAQCDEDVVLGRIGAGVIESLLRSEHEAIYLRILNLAKEQESWADILKYTWFRENQAYRVISKDFPNVALLGRAFGEALNEDDEIETSRADEASPTED